MGKKLIVACAIFVVLICAGCSDDDNPINNNNNKTHVIMPLAIGNAWGGTMEVGGGMAVFDVVYYIDKDSVINDETWYRMMIRIKDETSSQTSVANWFTNRSDGMYGLYNDNVTKAYSPFLYYKYPATVGTSYNVIADNDTVLVTVKSCATSYGSYSCYVYQTEYSGTADYQYLAPDVGFVRTTDTGYVASEWVVDSLVIN